ncbi:hypothetical protein NEHOM01_1658 [Nematocida homosporus]|uniref:uncharacterized protein n=1 Tax=Nematocida homosporus TaxID=1912981 RepID=UPI00221EB318|nr:uncharacterized protein NEHOM01_1658 [Nematocida homosporus]KAI5186719.1 hypothetical protein NEHOM01_1658 [Nematocida homosporus]
MMELKERLLVQMNETTKRDKMREIKQRLLKLVLQVEECEWETDLFLKEVQNWHCLAQSMDGKDSREPETLKIWLFIIETAKTLSGRDSNLATLNINALELIKSIDNLAQSPTVLFYLQDLLNLNENEVFIGRLNSAISRGQAEYDKYCSMLFQK